jgi:phosphotransferase system IIA component
MNERIKELAEQAWEYAMAVHDGHIVPPLNKEVWPIDKVLDEKFAELIVGECATAIVNDSRLNDVRSAANGCVRTIKQHFGVEE